MHKKLMCCLTVNAKDIINRADTDSIYNRMLLSMPAFIKFKGRTLNLKQFHDFISLVLRETNIMMTVRHITFLESF
jgi:hypothetical protein